MKLLTIGLVMLCSHSHAAKLTVVKDQSGSAPLLVHAGFAKAAANAAADRLETFKAGDILEVRILGETGLRNIGSDRQTVKRHKKAQVNRLYQSIKNIPSQKIQGQSETNILSFLTYTDFDCENGGEIFMISDGIESSSEVDANKLMAGGTLPSPKKDMLKGCKLTIFGLGLTKTPLPSKSLNHLITTWEGWSKIAGLEFKAVVSP